MPISFEPNGHATLYRDARERDAVDRELASGPLVIIARGLLALPPDDRAHSYIRWGDKVLREQDVRALVDGWFSSEFDQGTPSRGDDRAAAAPHHSRIAGRRVLVVEDEPLAAFAYQDALEDCGARFILASNLAEGLALLEKEDVDLAILDINLDGVMSWPIGQTLTRLEVPFLIVSAWCPQADIPDGVRPRDCIGKPIAAARIVARLEQLAA